MNILIETIAGFALLLVGLFGARQAIAARAVGLIKAATTDKTGGRYDQARVEVESALNLLSKILATGDSRALEARLLLNWILIEQDQRDAAFTNLSQLSAQLETKNASPRDLISVCIPLAWLSFVQNDLLAARVWTAKGIGLHEKNSYSANTSYASLLCVEAMVALKMNQLMQAEELLERSLNIVARETGQMSIYCAPILTNLGWLRLLQGEFMQARQLWQRALSTYCRFLGDAHPRSKRMAALMAQLCRIARF